MFKWVLFGIMYILLAPDTIFFSIKLDSFSLRLLFSCINSLEMKYILFELIGINIVAANT